MPDSLPLTLSAGDMIVNESLGTTRGDGHKKANSRRLAEVLAGLNQDAVPKFTARTGGRRGERDHLSGDSTRRCGTSQSRLALDWLDLFLAISQLAEYGVTKVCTILRTLRLSESGAHVYAAYFGLVLVTVIYFRRRRRRISFLKPIA